MYNLYQCGHRIEIAKFTYEVKNILIQKFTNLNREALLWCFRKKITDKEIKIYI